VIYAAPPGDLSIHQGCVFASVPRPHPPSSRRQRGRRCSVCSARRGPLQTDSLASRHGRADVAVSLWAMGANVARSSLPCIADARAFVGGARDTWSRWCSTPDSSVQNIMRQVVAHSRSSRAGREKRRVSSWATLKQERKRTNQRGPAREP
jgi:hypothetical protein